ncbi:NADPH-dependent F420 reductase [Nocardioides sp. Leaf307]|uniref:NADPH-dependent F420 reductase n=1 Tax=Nocardioides sp. Leaf307 TaxID=1736331 RepID=UPI002286AAA4|nr:NADPH-dependent F420 reductase [Nocardioides sp. Leaf307]
MPVWRGHRGTPAPLAQGGPPPRPPRPRPLPRPRPVHASVHASAERRHRVGTASAWRRPRNQRRAGGVGASMTTIGLIGAGNIGSTVARLAVRAGHDVVVSNSRGPETLSDLVAELGEHARAATATEAAEAGDVVVVTIPLKNYREVPVEPLRGKVVIDTNNYYPERDGHIAELDDESTTTAEMLQAHLPESQVVKTFNNIYFEHLLRLARPSGDPERSVLAIAGDDAAAKRTVTEVLDSLGYDAHDAGPLSEGWRFQRDTAAYADLYAGERGFDPEGGRRVDEAFLVQQLDAAKRYRDMA